MKSAVASLLALCLVAPHAYAARRCCRPGRRVFAAIDNASPGCAAGVMQGGETVYAKAYGLADLEHKVPLTTRSPVYLASVSKQFTAFVILTLERDGKLKRTDSVRKIYP